MHTISREATIDTAHKWWTLVAICTGGFMLLLDLTMETEPVEGEPEADVAVAA